MQIERGVAASRKSWWAAYATLPAALWVLLWLSLNAGPWRLFYRPTTLLGGLHFARAALPLFVCICALFGVARFAGRVRLPGLLKFWMCYGVVGLTAGAVSQKPLTGAWWGVSYLAVLGVTALWLRGRDSLKSAERLNLFTWVLTTVMLVSVLFLARDHMFVRTETDISCYRAHVGMGGAVVGMAMPRASGIGRFAAVPAVIAFVMLWRDPIRARRGLWCLVFLGSAGLVYVTQSRGAIVALAFALAFVVYLLGVRARIMGFIVVIACGAAIAIEVLPAGTVDQVVAHLSRNQTLEEMRSLTGRTRDWAVSWQYIRQSPAIGWGFQADRWLGVSPVGHLHNTYLYALLSAGMIGALPFFAGLALAWHRFLLAYRRGVAQRVRQTTLFVQIGGILAFFMVRSIPEVSGAYFSVDYMIMVPGIAYVSCLAVHRRGRLT